MLGIDSLKLNKNNMLSTHIEEVSIKDIAIIGVYVTMPHAENPKEFWEILRTGTDCIENLPEVRQKDLNDYLEYMDWMDKVNGYRECAYLKEIDKFDYSFFRLSPKEAGLMDPSQRLFLENVWKTIEDAGYGGKKLIGSRTGAYLGYNSTFSGEYYQMVSQTDRASISLAQVGNLAPVIASRISYLLDLKGPSMVVDTACSSSLVAIHLACQAIKNGECDMAIAGSVKINLLPAQIKEQEKIGIESSVNRTRTFDDSSDGTGGGEGVASVLMKPLDRAIRDRDNIYAIIRGSSINQDGNSIGISAPNVLAQEDVIVKAWKDSGIDPSTISYIEAHGTGTQLGDPIEIDGIQRAFKRYTGRKQFCAIGSLKTNVGHLDSAAGIAGLIKTVLALKHGEIPPSIHFIRPNRKIRFEESPVFLCDRLMKWKTGSFPRRAGVSSFGLSGTNCHMVLEERPKRLKKLEKRGLYPQVLTLSAKSEQSLRMLVEEYKKYISLLEVHDLEDICYTANTGRGHYSYRLAMIVDDMDDLKAKITELSIPFNPIDSNSKESYVFYGNNRFNGEDKGAEACIIKGHSKKEIDVQLSKLLNANPFEAKRILDSLCRFYVKGEEVDWEELYKNGKRQKVSLPVYQFERTRCWLDIPKSLNSEKSGKSIADIISREDIPEELRREIADILERIRKYTGGFDESKKVHQPEVVTLGGRVDGCYSKLEVTIAQAFGNVLGLKELGIRDDFYELGGDSIFALKVVNFIGNELEIKIEVSDLLRNLTVEKFARALESKIQPENQGNILSHIPFVEEGKGYYAVAPAQRRMYIVSNQMVGSTAYNLPSVALIEGELDICRLEEAFWKIIEKHETLRTSFEMVDGKPVQKIHKEVNFHINILEKSKSRLEIEDVVGEFVRPFDLGVAPLIRVGILELEKNRYLLLTDMHHIISDGTSMGILIREFSEYYGSGRLDKLNIQYKDYSEWLNSLLESGAMKKQEEFWINQLNGNIPVLDLPTDYPRPGIRENKGDSITFKAGLEHTKALKLLAKECGTSLYMVLLAAYYTLLYKYTGQEDIIIGCATSGRPNIKLEGIIGMFVNTLAMRNKPEGCKAYSELLNEVRENAISVFENQEYPIEMLVDKLGLVRDPSRNLLFDTLFVMQNMDTPEARIEGLRITPYEVGYGNALYDALLMAFETECGLKFIIEYAVSLFNSQTVEMVADHYSEILTQIIINKEILLDEIELSSKFTTMPAMEADDGDFCF